MMIMFTAGSQNLKTLVISSCELAQASSNVTLEIQLVCVISIEYFGTEQSTIRKKGRKGPEFWRWDNKLITVKVKTLNICIRMIDLVLHSIGSHWRGVCVCVNQQSDTDANHEITFIVDSDRAMMEKGKLIRKFHLHSERNLRSPCRSRLETCRCHESHFIVLYQSAFDIKKHFLGKM